MQEDFYNRYWSPEDAIPDHDPTTPTREAKLKEALVGLAPKSKVLDVGCGKGGFTAFIGRQGFQASGTDLSPVAIERAKQEHSDLDFRVLAMDRLPYDDNEFDAIWSSEVIEHVFDIHEHLSEINRVLKPGGRLILTTPYHGRLKNILISLIHFDRHFDPEGSHVRFFDKGGMTRCLTRAGFSAESWSGFGRVWPLWFSWFIVSKKTSPPHQGPEITG